MEKGFNFLEWATENSNTINSDGSITYANNTNTYTQKSFDLVTAEIASKALQADITSIEEKVEVYLKDQLFDFAANPKVDNLLMFKKHTTNLQNYIYENLRKDYRNLEYIIEMDDQGHPDYELTMEEATENAVFVNNIKTLLLTKSQDFVALTSRTSQRANNEYNSLSTEEKQDVDVLIDRIKLFGTDAEHYLISLYDLDYTTLLNKMHAAGVTKAYTVSRLKVAIHSFFDFVADGRGHMVSMNGVILRQLFTTEYKAVMSILKASKVITSERGYIPNFSSTIYKVNVERTEQVKVVGAKIINWYSKISYFKYKFTTKERKEMIKNLDNQEVKDIMLAMIEFRKYVAKNFNKINITTAFGKELLEVVGTENGKDKDGADVEVDVFGWTVLGHFYYRFISGIVEEGEIYDFEAFKEEYIAQL